MRCWTTPYVRWLGRGTRAGALLLRETTNDIIVEFHIRIFYKMPPKSLDRDTFERLTP
jgi:hypothetical protein